MNPLAGIMLQVFSIGLVAQAAQDIPIPFAVNPGRIAVNASRVFFIDGNDIYILSREDFSVLHKFGQKGEGPGEFIVHPNDPPGFALAGDKLILSAQNKVLEFDSSGTFVRQIKCGTKGIACKPLGDRLVGIERLLIDGKFSVGYQAYDDAMKASVRLTHYVDDFQSHEGFEILKNPYEYHDTFATDSRNIYIFLKDKSAIGVFAGDGHLVRSIPLNLPAAKVPDAVVQEMIRFWNTDPLKKQYVPYLKPITVAETYPALRAFRIAGEKIYVLTYQRRGDLNRCVVFGKDGDVVRRTWVPLIEKDPVELYPYAICDDQVFQLLEDDMWFLRISPIE